MKQVSLPVGDGIWQFPHLRFFKDKNKGLKSGVLSFILHWLACIQQEKWAQGTTLQIFAFKSSQSMTHSVMGDCESKQFLQIKQTISIMWTLQPLIFHTTCLLVCKSSHKSLFARIWNVCIILELDDIYSKCFVYHLSQDNTPCLSVSIGQYALSISYYKMHCLICLSKDNTHRLSFIIR